MLMLNIRNVDVFHHQECGILYIQDYEVLCDMFTLRYFGGEKKRIKN